MRKAAVAAPRHHDAAAPATTQPTSAHQLDPVKPEASAPLKSRSTRRGRIHAVEAPRASPMPRRARASGGLDPRSETIVRHVSTLKRPMPRISGS
jgi:hypothetical protein